MSKIEVDAIEPQSGTTLTLGASGDTVTIPSGVTLSGTTLSGTSLALTGNIGIGGATPTTSGTGITFPATASASTDANTLDDYEEGTWTPIYVPQTNSFTSITYDSEVRGFYTKIGKLVVAQAFIMTDAISVGTASGFAFIGGLPFTVGIEDNQVDTGAGAIGNSQDFGGDNPDGVFGQRNTTTAVLTFKTTSNGNSTFLNVTDLGTGANDNQMRISIIYRAA